MTNQLTKAIEGKMYSYNSRYSLRVDAREKAAILNGAKHAYYTKVTVKGVQYFDVRTENLL